MQSDDFSKNVNSEANENQAIDDISGKMHEITVARLLTQKGLANNNNGNLNNNNASVHSSTRSSYTSGGKFLQGKLIVIFISLHFLNIFLFSSFRETIRNHKSSQTTKIIIAILHSTHHIHYSLHQSEFHQLIHHLKWLASKI